MFKKFPTAKTLTASRSNSGVSPIHRARNRHIMRVLTLILAAALTLTAHPGTHCAAQNSDPRKWIKVEADVRVRLEREEPGC